jgi:hypothetical protein
MTRFVPMTDQRTLVYALVLLNDDGSDLGFYNPVTKVWDVAYDAAKHTTPLVKSIAHPAAQSIAATDVMRRNPEAHVRLFAKPDAGQLDHIGSYRAADLIDPIYPPA